eukprot:1036700-Pleurochrysis_carterae.AAC.1
MARCTVGTTASVMIRPRCRRDGCICGSWLAARTRVLRIVEVCRRYGKRWKVPIGSMRACAICN